MVNSSFILTLCLKAPTKELTVLIESKKFHYVTIKITVNLSFLSKHACSSIHPSTSFAGYEMTKKWIRNDQKGYEMTWVRIDHHIVISYPDDLGTK